MKTLLLSLCIVTGLYTHGSAQNSNLAWVDERVAAIKPPRKGISSSEIGRVKNPFIYFQEKKKTEGKDKAVASPDAKKPKDKTEGGLKLYAIMNESVLINGVWYRINDKVSGYKIAKIDQSSVLLTQGKKQRKLYITAENKNIKIQTK